MWFCIVVMVSSICQFWPFFCYGVFQFIKLIANYFSKLMASTLKKELISRLHLSKYNWVKSRFHDNLLSLNQVKKKKKSISIHILIIQKNKIQVLSEWQASLKKDLFHVTGEENRTWFSETETRFIRSVSVNSCGNTSIHIFHFGQVTIYHFPWNISDMHYLLHIRGFSASMTLIKICICRCWAAAAIFIFQVKIATSKSLRPIADDRMYYSITSINNINLVCSIICTIIFFKAIKHNMSQMHLLLFILNVIEKSFKRDCVTNVF